MDRVFKREREEQSLDWHSRKVYFLQREVQGALQTSSYPPMKNLALIIVLPKFKPSYYRRYVDDCFFTFPFP